MNYLSLVTPLLSPNPRADAWRAITNRLGSFCKKRVCKIGNGRRWWRCFQCKWRCLGRVTWISFLDWKNTLWRHQTFTCSHNNQVKIMIARMNSYLISYLYRNYSWGSCICMLAGTIQILTWKHVHQVCCGGFCSWWQWEVLPLHPWYGLVLLLNFNWLIRVSNKGTARMQSSYGG